MSQQIIVIVNPDGTTKVETKGFVGKSCQDASKALEQALGARLGETLKPEYYQTSTENRLKSGN